jgi:hypothetical protein
MSNSIDPRIFASLASGYAGGMRAPNPGQEGYRCQVDGTGKNVEYVADWAAAASGYDLRDAAGNIVGRMQSVCRRLTTSTTASAELARIEIPAVEGNLTFVDVRVVGATATFDYYSYHGEFAGLLQELLGTLTLVELATTGAAAVTNLASSHSLASDETALVVSIDSDAADGTVNWVGMLTAVTLYPVAA